MKNQALFSSKDKSKKLKCRLLQFLFGTLKVKIKMLSIEVLGQICRPKQPMLSRSIQRKIHVGLSKQY